jgi:hypothetical protein
MKKVNDYEIFNDSGVASPPAEDGESQSDATFVIKMDKHYRKSLKHSYQFRIQKNLIEKYMNCFQFYRDFTCLLALLAASGLLIAIGRWEDTFQNL